VLSYVVRRLIYTLPVILVAGVITFAIVHLAPGDPAAVMLGSEATAKQVESLRHELGLDRPIVVQFGAWIWNIVRGNLGESLFFKKPVLKVILDRLEPTVILAVLTAVIVAVMGIGIGVLSALKYGSVLDQALTSLAVLSASIPSFWLGMVLIMFLGVELRWFPTSGYSQLSEGTVWQSLSHIILPAICLGIPNSALVVRVTRSSMLDVVSQDYIRTARAKGLAERSVVLKHALRNTLVPVTTVIGFTIAGVIGGAVVTETVFAIHGVGRLVVMSVLRRDFPVIEGIVMFSALIYVVVNLIVDIGYVLIDPRVKY